MERGMEQMIRGKLPVKPKKKTKNRSKRKGINRSIKWSTAVSPVPRTPDVCLTKRRPA